MQALNVVVQLLSNIVPFSYYFLLRISHKALYSNCYLSIHMNNIINDLWYGTEEYYIPWDIIKLFKLHYLKYEKHADPIHILKFMIMKMKLELSQQDPKEEILSCVNEEIICESAIKIDNKQKNEQSKNIISYLFESVDEITYEVKESILTKHISSPFINLELPDFTGSCVQNPVCLITNKSEGVVEFYIKISKVESDLPKCEMWREFITDSFTIAKLYSIVAKYLDQILSTTISREEPKVQKSTQSQNKSDLLTFQVIDTSAKEDCIIDQFECIKLFAISIDSYERSDNKELKELEFESVSALINKYYYKTGISKDNEPIKKTVYLSGYCEKANGIEIEIILNKKVVLIKEETKVEIQPAVTTEIEAQGEFAKEAQKVEENEEKVAEKSEESEHDDEYFYSDEADITHCMLPIEALIKYRERPRYYWDGENVVKSIRKTLRFSPYRIFLLDRKFTSENERYPNCRKMMTAIKNTYELDLSRIHKELGSCVEILYTNDDVLNDYELIAFNNTRSQWVKFKDTKLTTYESFKDIESKVFTNCTVLVYKQADLEYQQMKSKDFFNSIS